MNLLKNCVICPRKCGVNRYQERGFCGADNTIKTAYYSLHMWEEPVLSGKNGSGTIFFSYCNLKCIYCQNKKISLDGYGKKISNKKLKEIMLKLQNDGAHNINLVTPTHYIPQIFKVLQNIKNKDLKIPVVYNTSSYENVGSLKILNGLIDIYLADLRYYDDELAKKYSFCDNYFEIATMAIDEMVRQKGNPVFDDSGMMKSGVIVRVLVLPGHVHDAKEIINYLYKTYHDDIYISIMNQYTPIQSCPYDNLNRKLSEEEYEDVINYALTIGVSNAFIQEGETALESFIPDFDTSVLDN